ncbi:MAG TPA: glucose 1-dehydrogenase [Acidimicrobiales bacterium]|nr:glucose 1-dehydrogenase [Acidimicrobiales bacterium]
MSELDTKVAVVTGAGAGIGAAIAHRLAHLGASVAVVDLVPESAEATASAIAAAGGRACGIAADVSDPSGRARLLTEASERLGPVGILVNNAAYHGPRVGFMELGPGEWERVIATNLTAAAELARGVAPGMISVGEGAIVNLTAIQAAMPLPTYVSYAASKGGLLALTRALAVELSPHGIRVNSVSPGAVATPSSRESLEAAGAGADAARAGAPAPTLLGRMGTPEEIAAAVAWLASPQASFITGTELIVDGGRRLSRAPDPWMGLGTQLGSGEK